jgi:hypothetical protein
MLVNFNKLSKKTKTPILSYCRSLISKGIDPRTRLEIFRDNNPEPNVIVPSIGEAAKWTVKEEPSVHFVKYHEPRGLPSPKNIVRS